MDEFQRLLDAQTSAKDGAARLPQACCIAADRDGNVLCRISSGTFTPAAAPSPRSKTPAAAPATIPLGDSAAATPPSPSAAATPQPFTPDTVCWIASMTKLMTTISCMQLVEQNKLDLDADLTARWLPEFRDAHVLVDMIPDPSDPDSDSEVPKFRPAKGHITLRQLLTHSSGISYEFMHGTLMSWRLWDSAKRRGTKTHADRTEVSRAFHVPLVFDPGAKWTYGYGLDWAGVVVERVSGLTLEEYMRENIWTTLAMNETTFEPFAREDLKGRVCGMTERDDRDGSLGASQGDAQTRGFSAVRHAGGGGCASTARDYIKLLVGLMRADAALALKPETVEYMFRPHLDDPSHLRKMHGHPAAFGLAGNIPPDVRVNYGLGGMVNQDPLPTGRMAGAMQWSGYPNLFWWVDRKAGICGCYFSQLIPNGDRESIEMYKRFEEAVYAAFRKPVGKL